MLRGTRFLVIALATLLASAAAASDSRASGPVELSIFHTNDLHSRLRASKNDPFGLGGLARIKTLLGDLRKTNPISITLDAGDWSEGAWYFSVDQGSNMLRFMDELGYDAVCVGNHELLDGPDVLLKAVTDAAPRYPVLAANFDVSGYSEGAALKKAIPDSAILNVQGLKIGVIGLSIQPGQYNSFIQPVKLVDPVESAKRAAAELRGKVDVLLIVSHNEFALNRKLAREVPGVNAVISGHTHIKTPKPTIELNEGREVPVVETGYWGKFVGDLKLVVADGKVTMKGYELHPVSADIAEDTTVAKMVDEQDKILSDRFGRNVNEVVAHTDYELVKEDYREATLGNLAAKSYRAATGADGAIEGTSFTGIGLAAGDVTVMDLHDVVPHTFDPRTGKEWTIHIWNAKGKDISLIFTIFYFLTGVEPTSSTLGWLSADNFDFRWIPIVPGSPANLISNGKNSPWGVTVRDLSIGGERIESEKRYRIAISDGMLAGLKVVNDKLPFDLLDISQLEDTGIEVWRAILDYGSKPGNLSLSNLGIGRYARTTGKNLAIYNYGISRTANSVRVRVENLGSRKSSHAPVVCESGIPDGFVPFSTSEQVWTPLGQAQIPALKPGTGAEVEVPWDQSGLTGYWPIRCRVDGGRYRVDDEATRVFRLSSR